jgi:hypothetical protein
MERIYIKRSDTKKHLKSSVYHKFTGRELEGSLVALMDEGAASPASFHLGYVDHVYKFGNLRSELRILVATGEMRTVLPDQLLNVRWKDLLNMQVSAEWRGNTDACSLLGPACTTFGHPFAGGERWMKIPKLTLWQHHNCTLWQHPNCTLWQHPNCTLWQHPNCTR